MSIAVFQHGHTDRPNPTFPRGDSCKWLRAFTTLVVLLMCGVGTAQESSKAQEAQSAKTKQAETRALKKLTSYIEKARRDWEVPGLAVAIVKDDRLLLSRGFGTKAIGSDDAIDEHTLFAIASNSKAFTAAALAILVDEHKLSWDDHVSQHLPWFKLKDHHATADIRVRDLLCHRSGLGTFSGDLLWWGTDYSPKEVLIRASELQPAHPFRAKYGYSNLMFLAAGQVIEAVSGKTWASFVEERIFRPLAMKRSVTSVRDILGRGNFATPHKTFSDRSMPINWMNWDSMAAAGGIVSSVDDMAKWLRLQLREGKIDQEHSLFSARQSKTMWEAHMPITISSSYKQRYTSTHFRAYGLGWGLSDYLGRKVVGHGGGYDGMYSQVTMVPEENLGIVVLTNSMTGISPAISYRILDHYLGGKVKDWSAELLPGFQKGRKAFEKRIKETTTPVKTDTHPSHDLEEYQGNYRCPMYGNASIVLRDGKLILEGMPNPDLVGELEHLHYDTFEINWKKQFAWFGNGTIHFVADSRGKFQKIELDVPNDDLWFYELKFHRID